ncbi:MULTISPECIES: hypothetical protein [Myxococcus]|uniref:hypothetical protein n=1 Tax=Myxococcus TaxID=32 RepID=UPI0013D85874|nr:MULTISPECIES: hypothetical protein [Myxococcus]NVJ25412.1 hypothetical protein [Myxococcus sp. AM011]
MTPEPSHDVDDVDEDPVMTEELRAVMHPRPHRVLLFTAVLVVVLGALAWMASRTVLASLWR